MNDERKFLHDISSPLTSIQLNVESVLMMLEEGLAEDKPACIKMLNTCSAQVKRIAVMIGERKENLVKKAEK